MPPSGIPPSLIHTPSPWPRRLWIVLLVVSIAATLGILALATVMGSIGTTLIFLFAPFLFLLSLLGVFTFPDYGMGYMGLVMTVPFGIFWTAGVTALFLFGPGKLKTASHWAYHLVRRIIIACGSVYVVGSIAGIIFLYSTWALADRAKPAQISGAPRISGYYTYSGLNGDALPNGFVIQDMSGVPNGTGATHLILRNKPSDFSVLGIDTSAPLGDSCSWHTSFIVEVSNVQREMQQGYSVLVANLIPESLTTMPAQQICAR